MLNKIISNAETVERNFLICLCKDFKNYQKVKRYIDVNDFSVSDYKNIFNQIKTIYDHSGFKSINEEVIVSYCNDKNIAHDDMNILSSFYILGKNIDLEFDGVYNLFRKNSGMNKFIKEANKYGSIDNMYSEIYNNSNSIEEVKLKIDNLNRLCFKEYKTSLKTTSLADGMVEYVKNRMFANDGKSINFMKMPLIQQLSKGIHVGVTFILAQSGEGKTSLSIPMFTIPILESGQKLLSIHNEQEEDEIRQLYLMSYISRVKGNKLKLHRSNFNSEGYNKFSEEQMNELIQCAREFEERYKDRLQFVFIPRFNADDLEALIIEYQRQGFENVLLDTFKQEDSSDGWEGLDTLAKKMDGISKELSLKIICTAQLAGHMSWRKYLTVSCIGKAKSIKEVATSLYMFRWLKPEEIPNIKYSYWVKKEDGSRVWENGKELPLNYVDKNGQLHEAEYIALFNDKQRKAKDGQVIILSGDLGSLYFKEVGQTNSIKNDDGGR